MRGEGVKNGRLQNVLGKSFSGAPNPAWGTLQQTTEVTISHHIYILT